MKLEKNRKRIDWWKWEFLLVLVINITFVDVIASRSIQVREPTAGSVSSRQANSVEVGIFSTDHEQLNETVAVCLEDYQTGWMSYTVYTTPSATMFEGTYILLGYEVPLHIYPQPSRLDFGAVQLKITPFPVSTFSLSESEVLKYVKSSYKLSSFIEVSPDELAVSTSIQNLENDADIYLGATITGLIGNQFNFDIYRKND